MLIRGFGSTAGTYAALAPTAAPAKPLGSFLAAGAAQGQGTRVSFSDEARALGASQADDIQARLDAIKAKPATARTSEDADYVLQHDSRRAEIAAKPDGTRTADEVDYMQKAGGFVNTMANLSAGEKQLYDELVAQGNTDAVRGMNLLALSRMGGGEVTLPNGRTFDPLKTEITPDNIRNLFSQMFVGSDDGQDARSFEALASYLEGRDSKAG